MHTSAVLLINLGSPESPTTKDLKPYLTEFLMDERVIDVPLWLRTILVKGIIVPFRAPKSAAKYKSIWTNEGSPLVVHTKNQCGLLKEQMNAPVYYSMRYGNPSTQTVLQLMHDENPLLTEIIVLPLYPHYAMSSYETAVEQVKHFHTMNRYKTRLNIIPAFYNHPSYIHALSESVRPFLTEKADYVLFSYHGIPERHVKKTDCTGTHCLQSPDCCELDSPAHDYCYRHQVITTTNLVAKELNLQTGQFGFSFQSRLGRDAWLKPFTVEQLKDFPKQGIKRLLILCPAFVSDCLETLEEISIEGKEIFLTNGGEYFNMIPALNEEALWINCMNELIAEEVSHSSKVIRANFSLQ
jgi:ferrochelatase